MALFDPGRGLVPIEVPDDWGPEQVRSKAREVYPFLFEDIVAARSAAPPAPEPSATATIREQMGLLPEDLGDRQFALDRDPVPAPPPSYPSGLEVAGQLVNTGKRELYRALAQIAKGGIAATRNLPGLRVDPMTGIPLPPEAPADTTSDPVYQASDWIDKVLLPALYPTSEGIGKTYINKLVAGAAGTAPSLIAGAAGGPVAAGVAAGLQSGQQGYEEALAAGRPEDAALALSGYGLAAGASEALLGAPGRLLKLDQFLPAAVRSLPAAVRLPLAGALRETPQEALEQVLQNVVAKYSFDPGRNLSEGVAEAASIAAPLGALMGGASIPFDPGTPPVLRPPEMPVEGALPGPASDEVPAALLPPLRSRDTRAAKARRMALARIDSIAEEEGLAGKVSLSAERYTPDAEVADAGGVGLAAGAQVRALYDPRADMIQVFAPAVRDTVGLREDIREEKAHRWLQTSEGRAAFEAFLAERQLTEAELAQTVGAAYARRAGESDGAYKARLTDEFLAKLNRQSGWRRLASDAVARVKNAIGLSLTNAQAGRLLLRNMRTAPAAAPAVATGAPVAGIPESQWSEQYTIRKVASDIPGQAAWAIVGKDGQFYQTPTSEGDLRDAIFQGATDSDAMAAAAKAFDESQPVGHVRYRQQQDGSISVDLAPPTEADFKRGTESKSVLVPKASAEIDPAVDLARNQIADRIFRLPYEKLGPSAKTDVDAKVSDWLDQYPRGTATTQTKSAAFKEWFGDWEDPLARSSRRKGPSVSVVVGSDGAPLRVFHSTRNDFSVFETGRPTWNNYGFLGNVEENRHAVFFTDSAPQAEAYSKTSGEFEQGARTLPVFLSLKSPIDFTQSGFDYEGVATDLGVRYQILLNTKAWELLDGPGGKEFVKAAKKAGYDGVIFEEDALEPGIRSGKTYAVFDPNQIKSASGNSGEFNPASPDIRFSASAPEFPQFSANEPTPGPEKPDHAPLIASLRAEFPTAPEIDTGNLPDDPDLARSTLVARMITAGFDSHTPIETAVWDAFRRSDAAGVARIEAGLRARGVEPTPQAVMQQLYTELDPARARGPMSRILRWLGTSVSPTKDLTRAIRDRALAVLDSYRPKTTQPLPAESPEQAFADLHAEFHGSLFADRIRALRGAAGLMNRLRARHAAWQELSARVQDLADQGRSRVLGMANPPPDLNLSPSNPKFEEVLTELGVPLNAAARSAIQQFQVEGKARVGARTLEKISQLTKTRDFLIQEIGARATKSIDKQGKKLRRRFEKLPKAVKDVVALIDASADLSGVAPDVLAKAREAIQLRSMADLNEQTVAAAPFSTDALDADIKRLRKRWSKLPEEARRIAGELRMEQSQMPEAMAAERLLQDEDLAHWVEILDRIETSGAKPRPADQVSPGLRDAARAAAGAMLNSLRVYHEQAASDSRAFVENVLPGKLRALKDRITAARASEGAAEIEIEELRATLAGELDRSGSLQSREAAAMLRENETAVMRFARALAAENPDATVVQIREALVEGIPVTPDAAGVRALAQNMGLGTEIVAKILRDLRNGDFRNAVAKMYERASASYARHALTAIEKIEYALSQGRTDEAANIASDAIAWSERSMIRNRELASDLETKLRDVLIDGEYHRLRADVSPLSGAELPLAGTARMFHDVGAGTGSGDILLRGFAVGPDLPDQPEIRIRPGATYDQAMLQSLMGWRVNAEQAVANRANDDQITRGLEVALGEVGQLIDARWLPSEISKTLAPRRGMDLPGKLLSTRNILPKFVPGPMGRRLAVVEAAYVRMGQQVHRIETQYSKPRWRAFQAAAKALGLKPIWKPGDALRMAAAYNEVAHRLRAFGSGVQVGDRLFSPGLDGLTVPLELLTLVRFDRDVFRDEAQRLALSEPYGGTRENMPDRQVVRPPAETGDVGLRRLAAMRRYEPAAAAYRSKDPLRIEQFWDSEDKHRGLLFHVLDSIRNDLKVPRDSLLLPAEKRLAGDIRQGRAAAPSSIADLVQALAARLPGLPNPQTTVRERLMKELEVYGIEAMARIDSSDLSKPTQFSGIMYGEGDLTEFTQSASPLAFPSSWYNYGAADGFRAALERIADPQQVEYTTALKNAGEHLRRRAELIDQGLRNGNISEFESEIRWHTASVMQDPTGPVTPERARAARDIMEIRANRLTEAAGALSATRSDNGFVDLIARGIRRTYVWLLSNISPRVSNVVQGPISGYFLLKPLIGREAAALVTVGNYVGSTLNMVLESVILASPQSRFTLDQKEKLEWQTANGLISSYNPGDLREMSAAITGEYDKSGIAKVLDVAEQAPNLVNQITGVAAGDRDLNLYLMRSLVPMAIWRLKAVAKAWQARLTREGKAYSPDDPSTLLGEEDVGIGGAAAIRELLGSFGSTPEEYLRGLSDPALQPRKFWRHPAGSALGKAMIEMLNTATRANRPNANPLLGLFGWTANVLNQVMADARTPADTGRGKKSADLLRQTLTLSLISASAYFAGVLARRALYESINTVAEEVARVLEGAPDEDDEGWLDWVLDALATVTGVIRRLVPVGPVLDLAAKGVRAVKLTVPTDLTPFDAAFWDRPGGKIAQSFAYAAPAGIGIDLENGYRLPFLGLVTQLTTGIRQAARGVGTVATDPSNHAAQAAAWVDVKEGARKMTGLAGAWGRAIWNLFAPAAGEDRETSSAVTSAARDESIQLPERREFSGLPATPVGRELVAAGRRLAAGDASAAEDIDNLTAFAFERAQRRALDRGMSEEEATKAGEAAVKGALTELHPYRRFLGRAVTEEEEAKLNKALAGNAAVARDVAAADAVVRRVTEAPPRGMTPFNATPAMTSPVRRPRTAVGGGRGRRRVRMGGRRIRTSIRPPRRRSLRRRPALR